MRLTLQNLLENGVFGALCVCYADTAEAKGLLRMCGYPMDKIPSIKNPRRFWLEVGERIDAGVLAGGFDYLLATAAAEYPANELLGRYRHGSRDVRIIVVGGHRDGGLLDLVTHIAHMHLGKSKESVRAVGVEGLVVELTGWTDKEAFELAREITRSHLNQLSDVGLGSDRVFRTIGPEQDQKVIEWVRNLKHAGASNMRVIRQLLVHAPGSQVYAVNNLPARTTIRELAAEVLLSSVEVYRHGKDDSVQPLRLEQTLGAQEIGGDETISIRLKQ